MIEEIIKDLGEKDQVGYDTWGDSDREMKYEYLVKLIGVIRHKKKLYEVKFIRSHNDRVPDTVYIRKVDINEL